MALTMTSSTSTSVTAMFIMRIIIIMEIMPISIHAASSSFKQQHQQQEQASILNYKLSLSSSSSLSSELNETSSSAAEKDHLSRISSGNQRQKFYIQTKSTTTATTTTTNVNQAMIQEELEGNTWDYATELIFIVLLAVLTFPANLFLFTFYTQKARRYKSRQHMSTAAASVLANSRYVSIANSFHTYLVEICSFDTVIVVYLILDTSFHLLFFLKKSPYESVFDISNFTCKFFIYILRISGAMSNYLVFLLSLNRCFLIFFRYKPPNEEEVS
jgi:hypothetical protein